MQRFDVDDDLVELVWERAKPKPFETLSFSNALRRILLEPQAVAPTAEMSKVKVTLEELVARARAEIAAQPKKAPSPNATQWAASVPELRKYGSLSTWKAVCDALAIDPAGDSARRKLRVWVAANRPAWPEVPEA